MKKHLLSAVIYGIPVIVVLVIIWAAVGAAKDVVSEKEPKDKILAACIQHTNIALHIHPSLKILIDGVEQPIPANVGITDACMSPVHTHDASGKIHLEYLYPVDFTLGDFFSVWGKTFSSSQILDSVADETHQVRLTVNGRPSEEYENLILRDLDEIVISYEQTAPAAEGSSDTTQE